MSQLDSLLQQLRRVYGDGPEAVVASNLLTFLARFDGTRHVTVPLVRRLCPGAEAGQMDHAIARVLQYLSGDGPALLKLSFEYIDADDVPHTLEDDEARAAIDHRINPLSGEVDEHVRARLLAYFDPQTDRIRLLTSEPRPAQ